MSLPWWGEDARGASCSIMICARSAPMCSTRLPASLPFQEFGRIRSRNVGEGEWEWSIRGTCRPWQPCSRSNFARFLGIAARVNARQRAAHLAPLNHPPSPTYDLTLWLTGLPWFFIESVGGPSATSLQQACMLDRGAFASCFVACLNAVQYASFTRCDPYRDGSPPNLW